MTTKERIKHLANWIWPDKSTDIYTCTCGAYYSIVERDESGNAICSLTPSYRTMKELLAFLNGCQSTMVQCNINHN